MGNLKFARKMGNYKFNLAQMIVNCLHELANEHFLIDSNVAIFRGNEHPV